MNTQTNVVRPVSVVASLLAIGADNTVSFTKGSNINHDELAEFAADRANASASASLQAVNAVRLARQLPDFGTGKDKVPAMKYVLDKVREGCKTPATFQNISYLIEAADIVANNGLAASPFTVKESLGYLRKVGAIEEGAAGAKLKMAVGGSVAKALKAGTPQAKMRPIVEKAKAAKPALFPKKGATSAAPAAPVKADDTADKINLDLSIIVGRWDKLAGAGKVAELRKAASDTVRKLALLAGLKVA